MIAEMAMAGINIAEGYSQAKIKQKQAKAQYEYERSAAANKALTTAASNMTQMADANVARANQFRQNNAIFKSYGNQVGQEARQAAATLDGLNSTKFDQRLQAAGNLGAMTAAASAAGVGGSSIEQVKQTERLRQQRADDAIDSAIETTQYNRGLTQTGLMDSAFNQLDSSPIFANSTYQAEDLVMDTSGQYKYTFGKAMMDGFNGSQGNLNNIGLNLSSFMKSNSGTVSSNSGATRV